MLLTLRTLRAFFVRDFLEEISYKTSFIFSFTGVLFSTLTFFFLSRLIGDNNISGLEQYDGDYFPFAIVGIALSSFFTVGLSSFARVVRTAQNYGTLEAMLVSPTPISLMIIGSALWSYAFTTLRVLAYFILAIILGLRLNPDVNPFLVFSVLLISIVSFTSIGIIAASGVMVIKRGDPITSIMGSVATLVGGILYPIETLPSWLRPVGQAIPLTYSARAMRDMILNGAGLRDVLPDVIVLLGFCVILLPLSLVLFRAAVNQARREGSLTHY